MINHHLPYIYTYHYIIIYHIYFPYISRIFTSIYHHLPTFSVYLPYIYHIFPIFTMYIYLIYIFPIYFSYIYQHKHHHLPSIFSSQKNIHEGSRLAARVGSSAPCGASAAAPPTPGRVAPPGASAGDPAPAPQLRNVGGF